MRIPHLRFIQTMIVAKVPPGDMMEELAKYSLVFPAEEMATIYSDIKKLCPSTAPKDCADTLEIARLLTYKYSYRTNLDTKPMEEAFRMLENKNISTMTYVLLLAGLSLEDLELTLNEKFDHLNISTEGVLSFVHYFFDIRSYSYMEKQELEKNFTQDVTLRRLFRVALKDSKSYVLWKLDAAPSQTMSSMLREMFTDSFYLFKEKAKTDPDTATKFGALALKLSDRIDKIEEVDKKATDIFTDLLFDDVPKTPFVTPTAQALGVDTTPIFKDMPKEFKLTTGMERQEATQIDTEDIN